jgi:large subunit ribosomal protein L21
MYAIFETGGKQYKVEKGDVVYIEKIETAEGENVIFDKVLYVDNGKRGAKVGTPYTTSVVGAKVLKQGKGKKLTVFTYKPKKNEKRKLGHRQPYTKVEIVAIGTKATVNKAFGGSEENAETAAE